MSIDTPGFESASPAATPLPCPATGSTAAPRSPALPRPWWRWHRSTWVVVTIALAVLAIANVSGYKRFEGPTWWEQRWQHGWPLIFLRRQIPFSRVDLDDTAWQLRTEVLELNYARLLANTGLALAICGGIGLAAEWRRRSGMKLWQWSLRDAAVAMVALSGAFAWLAYEQRNEAAVRALFAGGEMRGFLVTDDGLPHWLQQRLAPWGLDRQRIRKVEIRWLGQPSSNLEHLLRLRHLDWLLIHPGAPITEDELGQILQFTSLKGLVLSGNGSVTNRGLAQLGSGHQLQHFELDGTDVSDEGLEPLTRLLRLSLLSLARTHVTDACLPTLEQMPRLEYVDLRGTFVTEAGAARIAAALPGVEVVWDNGGVEF